MLATPRPSSCSRVDRPRRSTARPAQALESRSAPLATELAQMLDAMKLTSVAAEGRRSTTSGALYVPGIQLLVVRAKFSATDRMNYLLSMKEYRDAYVDLNSASERESRMSDLRSRRQRSPASNAKRTSHSTWSTSAGKSLSFDGRWGGKDNALPRRIHEDVRDRPTSSTPQMLQALIEVLKKSS